MCEIICEKEAVFKNFQLCFYRRNKFIICDIVFCIHIA